MRALIPSRTVALAAALLVAGAAPALAKCSAASLKGEWRITGDWGWTTSPNDTHAPINPPVRCDVRFDAKGKPAQSKCAEIIEYSRWTLTPKLRVNSRCEISGQMIYAVHTNNAHFRSTEYSASVDGWVTAAGDQMILTLYRRTPGRDEPSDVTDLMAYRRP